MRGWIGLLLLMPQVAWAGAWTLPKGAGELYLTGNYYSADKYYNASGDDVSIPEFSKYELNPYYQYGYDNGLTVGVSAFLQQINQDLANGAESDNWGLGNTEVFARWRAYEDRQWVVSIQPLVAFPTYYADDDPRAGREDFDGEVKALAGFHFDAMGRSHYVDAGFGYRARLGDEHDQWRANMTLGLALNEKWTLMPQIDVARAVGGTGNGVSVAGVNDYDLTKVQLSGAYKLDDQYTLQLGAFSHVDGENTGAGGGVLFSVWMHY